MNTHLLRIVSSDHAPARLPGSTRRQVIFLWVVWVSVWGRVYFVGLQSRFGRHQTTSIATVVGIIRVHRKISSIFLSPYVRG